MSLLPIASSSLLAATFHEPAAAERPEVGDSGITRLTATADSQMCLRLGGAAQITTRRGRSGWSGGLRDLDFVLGISTSDGVVMTPDAFFQTEFPVGTILLFDVIRFNKSARAFENRTFAVTLRAMPKAKPVPAWKRGPVISRGMSVQKKERPRFLQHYIAKHARLRHIDVRMVAVLLEYDGRCGIIPSHQTLANDLHCGLTAVKESLARLNRAGVLEITQRTRPGKRNTGQSNSYALCWPATNDTVVPLKRGGSISDDR